MKACDNANSRIIQIYKRKTEDDNNDIDNADTTTIVIIIIINNNITYWYIVWLYAVWLEFSATIYKRFKTF